MKRISAIFIACMVLLGLVELAHCQTATYLGLVAPKGHVTLDEALIDQAKLLGYEGVVIGVGPDGIQDPLTTSTFTDIQTVIRYALANGLKVHLRLGQNVPRWIYSNGVKQGPTVWVTKYHARNPDGSYDVWPAPFMPPLDTCKYIAQLVWQKATDILISELARANKPLSWGSEELINEPGKGGAGGCYSGDSFSTAVWPDVADGTILPYTWKMLRALRYSYSARGLATYAATLEGDKTSRLTEINCVVGVDAQRVSDGCTGWGFNRYASNPSSTPADAAAWWSTQEQAQVDAMNANPILANKQFFNTEFGMRTNLMKDLTDFTISDYRNAVIRNQRAVSNIVGAGYFVGYSTNSLGSGFELYKGWPLQMTGVNPVGPFRSR